VHPLFGRGIAQLLQADEQLRVTCLGAALADATEQLRRLRPDAIVVEGCRNDEALWDLFRELPPALIVRVYIDDDVIDVYQSRQVIGAGPDNLVEAIHLGLRRRLQPLPRQA
ncbi:MAG TPA: hypothetical protein VFT91_09005, partial [Dehalococcoidia bacterium]|nr:hypothetical protein [Dehalococcoidia bacterium]